MLLFTTATIANITVPACSLNQPPTPSLPLEVPLEPVVASNDGVSVAHTKSPPPASVRHLTTGLCGRPCRVERHQREKSGGEPAGQEAADAGDVTRGFLGLRLCRLVMPTRVRSPAAQAAVRAASNCADLLAGETSMMRRSIRRCDGHPVWTASCSPTG